MKPTVTSAKPSLDLNGHSHPTSADLVSRNKTFSDAVICGMGTAVPKYRVNHLASADFADKMSCSTPGQSRKVAALYRRTGIAHRGSVLLDQNQEAEIVNDFYPPLSSPDDRGPSTENRSQRYAVEAPALAVEASAKAIHAAGLRPADITHLVTVTCTGFAHRASTLN